MFSLSKQYNVLDVKDVRNKELPWDNRGVFQHIQWLDTFAAIAS